MDRRAFIAAAGAGSLLATGPAFGAGATRSDGAAARIATYVTGLRDHGGRVGVPAPGSHVTLLRVRDRAFDPLSIAVLAEDGRQLGFLPRIHGQVLSPLLDAGLAFDAIVADGGSTRTPRLMLELVYAGASEQT